MVRGTGSNPVFRSGLVLAHSPGPIGSEPAEEANKILDSDVVAQLALLGGSQADA
jgi:hypothetical protein